MNTIAGAGVRVRFAPSPTGFLHVGGARTALFNWLFARKLKGVFILRIEDTDEMRSSAEAVEQIIKALQWLRLNWDEGPYFQMQRVDIYRKYADELKAKGVLYECYCSEEELARERELALLHKRPPRYSKRCRHLAETEKQDFIRQGRKPVYRFSVPKQGETVFEDIVRGPLAFLNEDLEDFVVLKSSGGPTYNFSCVVDDHLMGITHVIRGDDHISNTPKQILLFQAFGWTVPNYAHISMILGSDGSRLSKRHGATSVLDFKEQGYLSYALANYLALLGWATEDSQDLFNLDQGWDELSAKFTLERCQKSPAVFDYTKLAWMNGIYIRKLSKDKLFELAQPFLASALPRAAGGSPSAADPKERLAEIVALEQEKYKTLSDVGRLLDFFFTDNYEYHWPELYALNIESLDAVFEELEKESVGLSDFSAAGVEQMLKSLAKRLGRKNAHIFHPLRFAVSGRLQGPSLFHMVEALGKEKTLTRLKRLRQAKALAQP